MYLFSDIKCVYFPLMLIKIYRNGKQACSFLYSVVLFCNIRWWQTQKPPAPEALDCMRRCGTRWRWWLWAHPGSSSDSFQVTVMDTTRPVVVSITSKISAIQTGHASVGSDCSAKSLKTSRCRYSVFCSWICLVKVTADGSAGERTKSWTANPRRNQSEVLPNFLIKNHEDREEKLVKI